jgi:aldehyde dehydrogenase (NAD+)
VGPALDPATQVGPASSDTQLEQNLRYVRIATDEGGRLVTGGQAVKGATPGFFMSPAVIADTAPAMRINNEEVFGPVASTVRAGTTSGRSRSRTRARLVGGYRHELAETRTALPPQHPRRHGVVNLPTAGSTIVPGGARRSSYARASRLPQSSSIPR